MAQARQDSFEAVALPHLRALYGMALRLTRDQQAAEDLVQDTMVKAFRFFHRFEEGSNAKAWLLKVLVNLFYNQYQKNRRLRRLNDRVGTDDHFDRFVSSSSLQAARNPEAALLDCLGRDRLRAAVDSLPEEYRAVVVLCDVEGLAYKEIAEVLDCPIGTVMSRLHRARKALQGKLREDADASGITVDLDAYRQNKESQ